MARTLFFQERIRDFVPFSMLLFEGLEAAVEETGLELSEENVVELLQDAMQALRYDDASPEAAAAMALRMSDMLEDEAKDYAALEDKVATSPSAKKPKTRTFGQSFLEWAQGLAGDQICLYVAGYDVEAARRLYCEEDRAAVMRAFHLRLAADWHQLEASLEAVVYGMGGGGGDDNAEVYDLDSDNPEEKKEAMDALAAFFRGGSI